jgi:hypothetical protein
MALQDHEGFMPDDIQPADEYSHRGASEFAFEGSIADGGQSFQLS